MVIIAPITIVNRLAIILNNCHRTPNRNETKQKRQILFTKPHCDIIFKKLLRVGCVWIEMEVLNVNRMDKKASINEISSFRFQVLAKKKNFFNISKKKKERKEEQNQWKIEHNVISCQISS